MRVGYRVVHEVVSVVRVTELGRSLTAHIILYKSANAKPFKVMLGKDYYCTLSARHGIVCSLFS